MIHRQDQMTFLTPSYAIRLMNHVHFYWLYIIKSGLSVIFRLPGLLPLSSLSPIPERSLTSNKLPSHFTHFMPLYGYGEDSEWPAHVLYRGGETFYHQCNTDSTKCNLSLMPS